MRPARRYLAVTTVCLVAAACGTGGFSGLYRTPLPGGADVGDHPYHVTAQFADVLDLVPQASVKVDDVAVGRVDKIDLAPDTRSAIVTMTVDGDVRVPGNAYADLRQSSLLGEKFVELRAPEAPVGTLTDGASIPLSATNRGPEVEEVLGALSLLLNGGGLGQLQDITHELDQALTGNEAGLRALPSRVDQLATELDGQRGQIIRAIDGLNKLSSTLVLQNANLSNALRDLPPGLGVLNQQRDQLVGMLQALDNLSGVAVNTIDQSKAQLVDDLRALAPTLTKLADAGADLPIALKIPPTYPLPDVAGDVVKGDYANVTARLDFDLDSILKSIENAGKVPGIPASVPPSSVSPPLLPPLPLPSVPGPVVPGLGGLLGGLLGGPFEGGA